MTRRILSPALLVAVLLLTDAAPAQPAGATLYEGLRLTGERIVVDRDVFDLNDTPFGARRTSSVDVSRGCRVVLFERSGYRGVSLERTRFGARRASSIEVPDGCMVTLFSEPGYRGRSTTFRGNDDELKDTPVGNDAAQSIRVECGQGRR